MAQTMSSQTKSTVSASRTSSAALQSSLHAATRSLHMSLNKSITARLPLSLPPHASDPTAYYTGMLMFGEIFLAFEVAMSDALRSTSCSARDREIIRQIQVPSLARSRSLRHDLRLLANRLRLLPGCEDTGGVDEGDGEHATPNGPVRAAAREQTLHIRQNIAEKPYLAMAYAWTMYLALFNGGRWLHRMLAGAGPTFWLEGQDCQMQESSTDMGVTQGTGKIEALSFWHFDVATEDDPEANRLKLEFKGRFDEASEMLTEIEQSEVAKEAQSVFETCATMVGFLDEHMTQQQSRVSEATQDSAPHQASLSWFGPTATSVWQILASRLASFGVTSLERPMRKEVGVVE